MSKNEAFKFMCVSWYNIISGKKVFCISRPLFSYKIMIHHFGQLMKLRKDLFCLSQGGLNICLVTMCKSI